VGIELSEGLRERLIPTGAVTKKALHPALWIYTHQRGVTNLVTLYDVLTTQEGKTDTVPHSARSPCTPIPASKELRTAKR